MVYMNFRKRWRNLWPRPGSAYELFDSAVFLILLGFIGYILTEPLPTGQVALQGLFEVAGSPFWGALLTIGGIIGVICSYSPRKETISKGMTSVLVVSTYWSAALFIGLIFFDAPIRNLISAVIYAYIATRMHRERDRL